VKSETSDTAARLLRGIPHSIFLSDRHGALHALVPNIRFLRPGIGTQPFSTELVTFRHQSGREWLRKRKTPYFMFAVHVSGNFLIPPTFVGSLALLALRFYHRMYGDVCHLAESIGTDSELNSEEQQLFDQLDGIMNDAHPVRAHAHSHVHFGASAATFSSRGACITRSSLITACCTFVGVLPCCTFGVRCAFAAPAGCACMPSSHLACTCGLSAGLSVGHSYRVRSLFEQSCPC